MLGMKLHDYLLKKISNHAIKSKVNITVSKKYRYTTTRFVYNLS